MDENARDTHQLTKTVLRVLGERKRPRVEDARAVLEQLPRQSKRNSLGRKVLTLAAFILEHPNIGPKFLDAEVVEGRILLYFDRTPSPIHFMRTLYEHIGKFGEIQVLAMPGDEMYEAVHASGFIFAVTPSGAGTSVPEDKVQESKYRILPSRLSESSAPRCKLTNDQVDRLLELAYGLDNLAWEEQEYIKDRLAEAVTSSDLPVQQLRGKMLRLVARKGVANGSYSDDDLYILDTWERFLRGTGLASRLRD